MSTDVPAFEKFIPINQLQARALRVPKKTLVDPSTGELWLPSKANGPTRIDGKKLAGDQLYGDTYIERLRLANGFEIRTKQDDTLYELSVWLKHITIKRKIVGNNSEESVESKRLMSIEKRRLERLYGSLTLDNSELESELQLDWKTLSETLPEKELSHERNMPVLLTLRTDEHSFNDKPRVILFAIKRNNQEMKQSTLNWSDAQQGWHERDLKYLGLKWAYLTQEVFDRLDKFL